MKWQAAWSIANGIGCDVAHKLYRGVLYFQNAILFHIYAPRQSTAFYEQIVTKLTVNYILCRSAVPNFAKIGQ